MAGIYREGLDENGQWEASMRDAALQRSGAIVDLGQVPAWMRKELDKRAKEGSLVKYRGCWDTLDTRFGLAALKTIWAIPEVAEAAGAALAQPRGD